MTNFELFIESVVKGMGFTTGAILTIVGGVVIIGVLCVAFGRDEK